jgi:hypothetical protein
VDFPKPSPQVCKYIAKFRLLEHGLLDAAHGVDDLRRQTKVTQDDDHDDESADETLQDFEQRLNLFVQIHLNRASSSKRDHYKDGLVFQARKDLIQEFRKVIQVKKCQNEGCGACVVLNLYTSFETLSFDLVTGMALPSAKRGTLKSSNTISRLNRRWRIVPLT